MKLLKTLSPNNYQIAVEIASIPELIRGYDVVKEQNLEDALSRQEELFKQYETDFVTTKEIKEKRVASN